MHDRKLDKDTKNSMRGKKTKPKQDNKKKKKQEKKSKEKATQLFTVNISG